MPKYALIAVTSPAEGQDTAFRDWYENVLIPELLRIPGMTGSRRFRIKSSNLGDAGRDQFIAIHEVDTDDLKAVLNGIGQTGKPPACLDPAASRTIIAEEIFSSD